MGDIILIAIELNNQFFVNINVSHDTITTERIFLKLWIL